MIDLGAAICLPREPICYLCPIKGLCGYNKNISQEKVNPTFPLGTSISL
jgi:adenine-specific DNA glycosylase